MTKNLKISAEELAQLRSLPDFDLIMVLSDLHDHGWPVAKKTLTLAVEAVASNNGRATDKRER